MRWSRWSIVARNKIHLIYHASLYFFGIASIMGTVGPQKRLANMLAELDLIKDKIKAESSNCVISRCARQSNLRFRRVANRALSKAHSGNLHRIYISIYSRQRRWHSRDADEWLWQIFNELFLVKFNRLSRKHQWAIWKKCMQHTVTDDYDQKNKNYFVTLN